MDLRLLESLVVVAEKGTIGEAAKRLGVSQSALSRRLQTLEFDLGVELLVRQGRGVVFTEMGRRAVEEGKILTDRYGRLKEELSRIESRKEGVVRIGGGATAVGYLLPPAIARFSAQHPGLRFEVREAGSREVEQAVVAGELDLGIVTLPLQQPDLNQSPLVRDRIVLVAGSQHPLVRGSSADEASGSGLEIESTELQGLPLVGFEKNSAIRRLIDDALLNAGVTMNVTMELRSISTILRLVESTQSLGFVSALGARQARVLPVADLLIERELALISHRDRCLSPAAQAFAEQLNR
ncbi:MAG: LysR family transcriptional regulator [Polyangiaceae bacterium]|nr:LysR family transcriptional regulator [Polyangiaceae bacterium]